MIAGDNLFRQSAIVYFAIVVSLLLAFSPSQARGDSRVRISAGIGASIPESDLSPGWRLGYNLGGALGYDAILRTLNVAIRIEYHIWEFNRKPEESRFTTGRDMRAFEIGPEIQYSLEYPESVLRPYVLIGAGWGHYSETDEISGVSEEILHVEKFEPRESIFLALGAGIKTTASKRVDFFVDARLTIASPEEKEYMYFPLRVGFDFWL
jgi:hypothetical protein